MDTSKLVAKHLRQVLYEKGISGKEFAIMIDRTQSQVSNYLNGEVTMKIDIFRDICIELKIDSNYLLGLSATDDMPTNYVRESDAEYRSSMAKQNDSLIKTNLILAEIINHKLNQNTDE